MNTRDRLIDTLFDNRYRIQRRIGAGGMANVYLAEDETLGRRVAIKVLNQRYSEDDQFVERFLREASAAARLNHPNIVQVYDRGEADDTYYIAMEFVDGMTLKELIVKRGELTEEEVVSYARQALNGMRFAHRNGIVHRDIKPHNFMIDTDGRLKIADFGIARAGADAGLTEVGSIVGTAQYLSPEQARGQTVSAASDLYSLGVVLFEMSTGRVPFDGDSPVNVALKHVNDPAPRPRLYNANVSAGLEAVIMKAMQKDPNNRYQTADELLADLDIVRRGSVPASAATAMTVGMSAATTVLPVGDLQRTTIAPPPRGDAGRGYAEAPVAAFDDDGGGGSGDRRDRRKAWPWVLLLGVVALLALAAYLTLTSGDSTPKSVRVPDVVGMQRAAAINLLRDRGFEVNPTTDFSTEPKGIVTDQDPRSGDLLESGSTVDITISAGAKPVMMPDVVGQLKKRAVATITGAGLPEPQIIEEFSEEEKGTVLDQNPLGGNSVSSDTKVTLTVSKGEETSPVPSVVGMSTADAQRQLRDAGFVVEIATQDGPTEAGIVASQQPTSSNPAKRGSTVTIVVGSGQNVVPDVMDQSPEEATGALQDAGFEVAVQDVDDPTMTPGETPHVSEVDPAPNTRLPLGQTVTITVANPPVGE